MCFKFPPLILALNEQLKLQGFLKRLWFMLLFRNKRKTGKALRDKHLLSWPYLAHNTIETAYICQTAHQLSRGARSTNPSLLIWDLCQPIFRPVFPLHQFRSFPSIQATPSQCDEEENKPCSTAPNLITHIFFDVLWFHGFVGIICGVKSAKYKPGKNQTTNGLDWFPVSGKPLISFSCLLNVFVAL